jgi:hypothetical protein
MDVELATTPQNSFCMYDDLVKVETFAGEIEYHGDGRAEKYAEMMDLLWEEAATDANARRLIVKAVDALER